MNLLKKIKELVANARRQEIVREANHTTIPTLGTYKIGHIDSGPISFAKQRKTSLGDCKNFPGGRYRLGS